MLLSNNLTEFNQVLDLEALFDDKRWSLSPPILGDLLRTVFMYLEVPTVLCFHAIHHMSLNPKLPHLALSPLPT